MKYSTELRRHHQVLFGIKMLALHNTLQQKEPSNSSKGFLGCNPTVPGPLCVWLSVLMLVSTGQGSTANVEVRLSHASWAQLRNKRNYQRERGQWHIQHLLSSYSPRFYLLLQIRTFLERKERFCWQYGFKTLMKGKSNTITVNELTAPAPKPTWCSQPN